MASHLKLVNRSLSTFAKASVDIFRPPKSIFRKRKMELATGIGPVTCRLQGGCSTN
jgi:hypothetical protein